MITRILIVAGMQQLMDISNEVHQKLEAECRSAAELRSAQSSAHEHVDLIDHTEKPTC